MNSTSKFYCDECEMELTSADVMTPVMRGFFGRTWVHKKCMKVVRRIETHS